MIAVEMAEFTALFRFMFGVILTFGILPMVVLARPAGARNLLDAYVTNLVRWLALIITLAHILTLTSSYSRVSLIVSVLGIAWFARYRRQVGGFAGLLQRVYMSGDDKVAIPKRDRMPAAERRRLAIVAMPVVLLMIASYALRARDVFGSVNLSPPDAYIHMSWANGIQQGTMWSDGVYPQGLASILAVLQSFTPFLDMIEVARFAGPMIGTFLVFAIYYAVVRLTRNPGAALLSAGLIGIFAASSEWRHPWERHVGLLPQELGLAIAILAMVFAVLAVTEKGGGRFLALGSSGGLTMSGNMLTLGLAAYVVAMIHPYPLVWLAAIVGVGSVAATLVTRRFSFLIGAGVAAVAGAAAGLLVIPAAEFFGVRPYLGYGALQAIDDVTTDRRFTTEQIIEAYNELEWLQHNWLSLTAAAFLVAAIVGVVMLLVRKTTRTAGAQLLGLTAAASLSILLFDLTELAYSYRFHHVVRLAYMIAPTLALAFGAGLGAVSFLVVRKASFARIVALMMVGIVALGAFAVRFPPPTQAIAAGYAREAIEWDEMTRVTLDLRDEHDRGTYSVVGITSQRQVLAGHGWFIEAWVFAREIDDIPDDDLLPVPTPDTYVFVEMDPFPAVEIEGRGPSEEYYFNLDKRGRIQATIYAWAERRRAVNPDTTIHYDGEHVRVYRIARNPAITIATDDLAFQDYSWQPGQLFTEGATSPRELQAELEGPPDDPDDIPDGPVTDEPAADLPDEPSASDPSVSTPEPAA